MALTGALEDAGVEIVDPDAGERLDGLITVLSASALDDPSWHTLVGTVDASRTIPVRVGTISTAAVPERLRELNWIDWTPATPATLYGSVLAALLSDPARLILSRQLLHEAEAWERSGRSPGLLLDDRKRAEQMQDLLTELASDPMAKPTPLTLAFVQQSVKTARRIHKRRRRWRVAAVVVAVMFISAGIGYLPEISQRARINHAAIVTAGEVSVLDALPEWSAANAATLMLEGTSAQQALGRTTLLQAIQRPWTLGNLNYIEDVRALETFAHGRLALVLGATARGAALALVRLGASHLISSLPLSERYERMDVSADGRRAVVAGLTARAIEVPTGATLALQDRGPFAGVRVAPAGGQAALWTPEGRLDLLDLAHGRRIATVGRYAAVLDVTADSAGALTALVMPRAGEYAIVTVHGARVLARATLPGGIDIGALAPDGRRAIVAGSEEQFWSFGAGKPAAASGIPVPAQLDDIRWASNERVVVASDSERGEVFYLPRAEPLGHVCWDIVRPLSIRIEADSETISCLGTGLQSLWKLPPAPRPVPAPDESSARTAASANVSVQTRDEEVRIVWRGAFGKGSTAWFAPAEGAITAMALSPSGRELVVGTSEGQAAVIDLGREAARTVIEWHAPDFAPVTGVAWTSQGSVVTTRSNQTWTLPDCRECLTDGGLLDAVRARFTGCLTARQAAWMDDGVRERIDVRLCPPQAPLA